MRVGVACLCCCDNVDGPGFFMRAGDSVGFGHIQGGWWEVMAHGTVVVAEPDGESPPLRGKLFIYIQVGLPRHRCHHI